jgi:hypothetical protein
MAYAQWNPATYYLPNDIVDYEGLLYIATGLQPNINQTPDPAGTTYWGVNGGGGSGSTGVDSVTSNPTGGGISISGSPANPVVSAYQWPFLQMSSKTNNVTLPSTVTLNQPGTVYATGDTPPVLLFTSTFDAPVTGSGYSNALFTVSFTNCDLYPGTGSQQFYNIQIFPWLGSTPPTSTSTNVYAYCSSPIQFNQIITDAQQNYPVIQPQAFTVTLNPQGQVFETVQWYAVNLQTGASIGYLLDPNGSTPTIHWSGFAWNTTGTTAG